VSSPPGRNGLGFRPRRKSLATASNRLKERPVADEIPVHQPGLSSGYK
jgi:hypothetical protein